MGDYASVLDRVRNGAGMTDALTEQAADLVNRGTVLAQEYNSRFFDLGELVCNLRVHVTVLRNSKEELVELWTLLAPAGETSLLNWLESEWDVPVTSLSSAAGIVDLYVHTLGWKIPDLARIGRAKLSAAKTWLSLSLQGNRLDESLIAKLQDGVSTVEEIKDYVSFALRRTRELQDGIKPAGIGDEATNVIPARAVYNPATDSLDDLDDDADDEDVGEDGATFEDDAEPDAVFESVAAALPPLPLPVLAVEAGSMDEVLWRQMQPILTQFLAQYVDALGGQGAVNNLFESLHEAVYQYFGGKVLPLQVRIDGLPYTVGSIVLQELDEQLEERVLLFLHKSLKG